MEESHRLYAFGVELYNRIQRTAPLFHHVYFNFLEAASVIRTKTPLGADRFRAVLERVRPESLGAAARIPGVTPAALVLLLRHVRRGGPGGPARKSA